MPEEIYNDLPAFFFNAEIRDNGTARRIRDAAVRFHGKSVTRYNRPPYKGLSEHPLYIFVDDGRDDIPMEAPHPSACWLVDTHLGYETRLNWARQFDYVFAAQMPTVGKMKADGIESVYWLPLACHPPVDPTAFEMKQAGLIPEMPKKEWDVCFVGHLNKGHQGRGNDRIEYLDRIFHAFPNSWMAFGRFFEEAAARYVRSRTGFNVSITDDLNMRFFEVLSYGVCLVTNNDVAGWKEMGFQDRVHFVGYRGVEEAIEAVKWCLDNPMEREEIARTGNRLVREKHTYLHRYQEILRICGIGA